MLIFEWHRLISTREELRDAVASISQIILASRPRGRPQLDNFRLEQVAVPATPTGGALLRTLFLSLDPYMRGRMDDRKSYAEPVGIGEVMGRERRGSELSLIPAHAQQDDLTVKVSTLEELLETLQLVHGRILPFRIPA
jgi:NADPH-dependent curcumin reductase CurA